MPITSIGSYLTTLDEVIFHWDNTNEELGGTPETDLTLQGAFTRDNMIASRATLQAAITGLEDKENDRQIAANVREMQKNELRGWMSSFRGMLKGKLPRTVYLAAAPTLPTLHAAETKFLGPLDDMANLWAKIDADTTITGFTPPLRLAGGYDRAAFVADLAQLRTAFGQVTLAEHELLVAREQRDALLVPARERMIQYRTLVEATFGPGHPLVLSLPSVTPTGGSHTVTGTQP